MSDAEPGLPAPLAGIPRERWPRHVAVIMDGNGRWAQARGLPRAAGHREGVATVRRIVTESARLNARGLGFAIEDEPGAPAMLRARIAPGAARG